METELEKHYRPSQVAEITGYSVAAIRKLILQRRLGYRKSSRAIMVPASEIRRLLGALRPAIEANGEGRGR